MIRTETEYHDALERLGNDRSVMHAQREELSKLGLSASEVEHALQPSISFHEQLCEEVEAYERLRRGDKTVIENLAGIGQVLICLRIAAGLTQTELARRLGSHVSQVSRDERNDYHGITLERAQKVLEALGGRVRLEADVDDDRLAAVG